MSREIEFRCWNAHSKCFHGMSELGGKLHLFSNSNQSYVIEQYTGLKDCNGFKIFEGDIVFKDDDYPGFDCGVVRFSECGRWLAVEEEGDYEDLCDFNAKIIGNIHQNPELLRGGNA